VPEQPVVERPQQVLSLPAAVNREPICVRSA